MKSDIHVAVPRVPLDTCPSASPAAVPGGKLSDARSGEASAVMQERVEGARSRQAARFATKSGADGRRPPAAGHAPVLTANADMGPTHVREFCAVDETCRHTDGAGRGDTCTASNAVRCKCAPD